MSEQGAVEKADLPKREIAVICPEGTRTGVETPFLRLFRNNATDFRERFKIIATEGTAKALARTGFYNIDEHVEASTGESPLFASWF